ncbi:MAG: hypothetical protein H6624_00840 [Bdellovibrionaceae bacterium]|nr:hypothetical protein [Bdellovibrionales bacterium]MCB9082855.1 hypothetical protein [Pseudobdellovibrionaceae bacterium]
MKKAILGAISLALSLTAVADPTINPMGMETYEKLELYDQDGKDFTVEVDYVLQRSCGAAYMYQVSKIDEETAIVTKRALPRRAYCPPPEHWPLVQHGIKFDVPSSGRYSHLYLLVPKGSKVVLRGSDYHSNLPAGLGALDLSLQSKFGSNPGFMINISGELNSPNYGIVLGKPKVDEAKRTVLIPVRVTYNSRGDLNVPAVGVPFSNTIDINTYQEGTWTVVLVDGDGNSLRKQQVDVFNVYFGGR